jgi:hypothetical protein
VGRTPDRVTVHVSNGRHQAAVAVAAPGGGTGLVGLAERVRLLGGVLRAEPTAEGGYSVVAELPLEAGGRQPAASEPLAPTVAPLAAPRPASRFRFPHPVVIVVGGLLGLFALAGLGSVVSGLTTGTASYPQAATAPQVGMPLRDFIAIHGVNDALAQLAARDREPPPPAGAVCLYQPGRVVVGNAPGQPGAPEEEITIHRYCFTGDRLVDVRDVRVTTRVA